jgi:shikimate kinase
MNLFIIGYRCTGKTTVGKALAQRLNWSFVDTDQIIVRAAGVSIAQLVETCGWPSFRDQEHKALQTISADDRQVVATGGGIVLDAHNITTMKKAGKIVWLTASEKTIQARMQADELTATSRPSLTGQGRIAEITAVLSVRRPFYEKAGDFSIATDRSTVTVICDRIIAALGL